MAEQSNELLEMLLRECQAAAPQPWYPVDYVQQTGLARATIDADLDRLRLAGLVRLSDWVQGKGQGYLLTPEGSEFLQNPRHMKRLRSDGVAPAPAQAPLQPATTPVTTWERGEAVRNVLLHPGRPIVTQILLVVTIFIFLVEITLAVQQKTPLNQFILGNEPSILDKMGAVSRPGLVEGDWWRLLTYVFLHSGLLHIVLNMVFLYMIGPTVETMFGSLRFLILYLLSGMGGGVAVVLWGSAAVGASGSLCGMLAAMIVWVLLNRHHLPPKFVSTWLNNLLMNALLIVFISMMPRVSAAGHLGGAVAGAIVAAALVLNRWGRGVERWLGLAGTIAAPLVCIGLIQISINSQDRDQANRVLARKILLDAEDAARNTYQDYAKPLLEKDDKEMFQDAGAVKDTLREFAATEGKLKSADTRLQSISFSDPVLSKALELGREYVAAWSAYYDLLDTILTRETSPTKAERGALTKQFAKAQTLTKQLGNSPLFSR